MSTSHTTTKLNCAYISLDICRILTIGQKMVNFRNSDCVTTPVDYVESVDSAVCGKHAVSYFGASFWQN